MDEQNVASKIADILRIAGVPELPSDYTIFDVETTGFDMDNDLIVQIGLAVVRKKRLVTVEALAVNWTSFGELDQAWLTERLHAVTEKMAEKGLTFSTSLSRMREEGAPPYDVFSAVAKFISQCVAAGEWLVGHNLVGFDVPMLSGNLLSLGVVDVPWAAARICDTGMVEKAIVADVPIANYSDLSAMYDAVRGVWSTEKWSLTGACDERYRLQERYGLRGQAHDAGYDCKMVFALLETYRAIWQSVNRSGQ